MPSCRMIAGLLGLLMAGAASAAEPTECDRLAGSPTDPNGVGAGIGLYGIDSAKAIAACETALAADPRNPRLLFNLGRAHAASGLIDKQPDQKAQAGQNFKAAADQNYPAAQIELAAYYWYGSGGFEQDVGEAMRLLEKAKPLDAKEVRVHRQGMFGDATFAPDPNEAQIRIIAEAADAGDADALYALSLPLNLGGDRKAELADVLHKAAALGSAQAASDLARMYYWGRGGLAKNLEETLRLVQQAAAGDDPVAWASTAFVYENGNFGVPKDEKQAARLFKQASDEGQRSAQYGLGRLYEEGRGGLPRDPREAARLYKLAADQGYDDAVVALSRFMVEGQGGYQADKAGAIAYLKRASRWSTQAKNELTKLGG